MDDLYVINDSGPQRYAISPDMSSGEEGANKYLATLQQKASKTRAAQSNFEFDGLPRA